MRKLSVIILGISLISLLIYDIVALALGGVDATFSDILTKWSFECHPIMLIAFGSVLGGLLVHWFWVDKPVKYNGNFFNEWLAEPYGEFSMRSEYISEEEKTWSRSAFEYAYNLAIKKNKLNG